MFLMIVDLKYFWVSIFGGDDRISMVKIKNYTKLLITFNESFIFLNHKPYRFKIILPYIIFKIIVIFFFYVSLRKLRNDHIKRLGLKYQNFQKLDHIITRNFKNQLFLFACTLFCLDLYIC